MRSTAEGVHLIAAAAGFISLAALWLGVLGGALIRGGWDRSRIRPSTVHGFHMQLTMFGLTLGVVHALGQLAVPHGVTAVIDEVVPFLHRLDPIGVGLGTLGLELAVAVAASVLVQSRLGFRFWLPIHAIGYVSFILVAVHTLLAGSDVGSPYVRAAIGVGISTALLAWVATLRPIANLWSGREYGEEPAGPRSRGVTVRVDPGRCEIFGFCVQEAPALFSLRGDSRLKYRSNVPPSQTDAAVRASQVCPTRAITLGGMPSYQTEQSEPLIPQWTAGPRQVTAAPVVPVVPVAPVAPVAPVPPVAPAAGYGPPGYGPPVAPAAYPPQVYPPAYPAQQYVQPAEPQMPADPVWPGTNWPNGLWASSQGSSGRNADVGDSGGGKHSEDRHRDDDGGQSDGRQEK